MQLKVLIALVFAIGTLASVVPAPGPEVTGTPTTNEDAPSRRIDAPAETITAIDEDYYRARREFEERGIGAGLLSIFTHAFSNPFLFLREDSE
jgi:hypothetical protein